jgi:hypothetical protein
MKYVVTIGNLSDGFFIVGPFDTYADAERYVERDATPPASWRKWIMELRAPAEEEN